jgi:hypothetical protein
MPKYPLGMTAEILHTVGPVPSQDMATRREKAWTALILQVLEHVQAFGLRAGDAGALVGFGVPSWYILASASGPTVNFYLKGDSIEAFLNRDYRETFSLTPGCWFEPISGMIVGPVVDGPRLDDGSPRRVSPVEIIIQEIIARRPKDIG